MKQAQRKSFDWYKMQQRFSIRKYHFGAASVLLGTALILGIATNVHSVQAEEKNSAVVSKVFIDKGEEATKPAEVSTPKKETTYAAPTVANPVEVTPTKFDDAKAPAEKVEEAKDKKVEASHQDSVDKSKLLTALSLAKKLESKLYTEASAANLQASMQAGQSLLGKADATEAELSQAESSVQSAIIGLELRSNSDKGTVSETPVVKKADEVEAKEDATTADRSALDSSVLATNVPAKVEATSATETTNEIFKPEHSLSDDRQNSAIRKEDLETGYSGFRSARRRREAGNNPDETPTQPASTQPASGEYAGTEIKAYYDNNHNGVFDEGDELISSTVIPPAPKGENGNDGKDAARGAELLSGIIAPTPEDGKDGDTYIDATTGDVYKKRDGAWGKIGNLRGPQGEQGQKGENGKDGRAPKIKVEDIAKSAGTTSVSSRSGIRITVYDDKNNNDEFDEGDTVLNTKEVYNGTDGRNGVDGQTPKVKAERDEAKKQTTLTFYIDKDGDGNYTEGTDTLVQTSIVKDGQDGATGQAGRDGKEVLNGKVDPQATDGKDGDSFVNTATGDVFVKKNNAWEPAGNIKGPKGDKGENGKDGFTPEVTVTDNHDGSHTITITQPEGRPALTTVVKNGENGQTPKVKAERDEAKKQTTLTFYIDKDGDGNYTEGTDTLVQTSIVKDGQDGATGQAGRDGKEVLNGKVDPQATDGKDGDSFVNTATGDVFVKKNNAWEPAGNIKGPKGDKGENGKDGFTPEVTVTDNHDGSHTITITQPEGRPALTTVVKNGENGQTPKVKAERDEAKKQTTLTFYIDKDGDGNYTERTDTLVQTSIVKDGQDGKSLITVKEGKETKVYQEDPTHPGQPLNPEKPLAVIKDGVDGKSPTVTAIRKDEEGHKGVEITVDNHDGSQPTKVFVQDGEKGEAGVAGHDGQTPTVITQRGADGHSTLVTLTTPGKEPVTFTVRDGLDGHDGRAPKIDLKPFNHGVDSFRRARVSRSSGNNPEEGTANEINQPISNEHPSTGTHVTAYYDNNGNDVYDPGVDELLSERDVLDGNDGVDGNRGRDGRNGSELLSGNVAPTPNDGKNGDTYIDSNTGDVYKKNNGTWNKTGNIRGPQGAKGDSPEVTAKPGTDGNSTDITITTPGKDPITVNVKNGKDGKTPKVEVTDNNDGTHTVKVTDGDGNVTNAIIKDGKDGKAATATTNENPDGSHTVTITNPDGTKNEFVVKNGRDGVDGRTPTASVRDNGDGSHTIVITNPEGVTTETTVRDGKSPKVTITDEQNGTHKISVLNGDGTTTETIIKDGKSPVATVRDNQDGTYTIRVENGNGTVSETTVRDGKSPTAKVVDNGDGTHTITVVNSDGTTTTTTVRDGKSPKLEVIDNKNGSHTIKVTGADGKETTTTIFDGKSPKANIIDNGDGTHTLTIVDSDGREYKSIIKDGKDGKDGVSPTVTVKNNNDGTHVVTITNPDGSKTEMVIKDGKDGKSPKVSVEDNGDGSHTITIINSDGTVTKTVIKDGKDGKCGCQDKPVTPSNEKPVPPIPNVPEGPTFAMPEPPVHELPEFNGGVPGMPEVVEVPELDIPTVPAQPTPEVPVKPVPVQPTPNVPTPEVPVQPTPVVPTPEVPVKPVPAVPEQPVVPTPDQPATPVNATPVVPTTVKENHGDKLPETGSQSDYISVLLGSGILLSLYVGRRKED
mgnify:CR=1 FL=1